MRAKVLQEAVQALCDMNESEFHLAVADLLEYAATCVAWGNTDPWTRRALAVARAYLGDDQ